MSGISYTVRGHLADGKGAEFTALSAELSAMVDADEPGTLAYVWYLNDAGDEYLLYERYTDSDAFLRHVEHVAPLMDRFQALGPIDSISVFGDPTPEASAVLEEWKAVSYTQTAGFMRH